MGSLAEWLQKRSILRTSDDLIPEPIPVRLVEVTDSAAARQNLLNTSGQVTEANSSSIDSQNKYQSAYWNAAMRPLFGGLASSPTAATTLKARPLILDVTYTATAGGEIVAAALVPAVASYQSCVCITGLWSDQTDAGIAMTFTSSGAGTVDPVTNWTMATTAGAVTSYLPGVCMRTSADNVDIDMACAAGQAGNAQVVVPLGYYWYET